MRSSLFSLVGLAGFCCVSIAGYAAELHSWQMGTLRDAHNNIIGRIDAGGRFYSKDGERYGSIDSDGAVRDKYGQLVGDVTINGLIDLNGERVGHIDPDGDVRGTDGSKLGTITPEGKVYENHPERQLGTIPPEDKAVGALMILKAKENEH
ncbi:hypothetical protein PT277_05380 [Acetobacteraceae bacterium ESL0709]|nr:hypothetical protein [Acetobacteraceae bacterium ESL0697]MDF7678128.1 hypothetical protein [Acetobacteraceae bacterium ESL0709]